MSDPQLEPGPLESPSRDFLEGVSPLLEEILPPKPRGVGNILRLAKQGSGHEKKKGDQPTPAPTYPRPRRSHNQSPGVSRKTMGSLVPAGVVTVTSYSPGVSTMGGASPVLGASLGTQKVIRVPFSEDGALR